MDACLHCGEPISQTQGKRQRVFCSDTCRASHWAKKEVVQDSWQEKYYTIKRLYDPLLIRVAELEAENKGLRQRIAYLEPSAASHATRMQGTAEAIKEAPKQVLTTSGPEVDKEAVKKQIQELKSQKCPGYMNPTKFRNQQDAKIEELQKLLK